MVVEGGEEGVLEGILFIYINFQRQGSMDSCRITLKQILKKNNNLSFVAADRNILFLLRGEGEGKGKGYFLFVSFSFLRGRRE